jgi:hypothetical protein
MAPHPICRRLESLLLLSALMGPASCRHFQFSYQILCWSIGKGSRLDQSENSFSGWKLECYDQYPSYRPDHVVDWSSRREMKHTP